MDRETNFYEELWSNAEERGEIELVKPKPHTKPHAVYGTLTAEATTPEAKALVEQLVGELSAFRKNKSSKLGRAVEAFLGDLLKARATFADWTYIQTKAEAFTGKEVTRRVFLFVAEGLERLGYLERNSGDRKEGLATTFRPTEKLVELVKSHKVLEMDFERPLEATRVLSLRASSKGFGPFKEQGKKVSFVETTHTKELEAEVEELNSFLSGFRMTPGPFTWLVRIFGQGDQNDHGWRCGGRLYASYQTLSKEDRRFITIDGQEVTEVDVNASHLRVYYGLMKGSLSVTEDPYEVDGLDRSDVKEFINASLSKGELLTRWARGKARREDGTPRKKVSKVTGGVLAKHPLLGNLSGSGVTWASLQFHESQALIHAMKKLKAMGVPAYPIHDALMVRAYEAEVAKRALVDGFKEVLGIEVVVR